MLPKKAPLSTLYVSIKPLLVLRLSVGRLPTLRQFFKKIDKEVIFKISVIRPWSASSMKSSMTNSYDFKLVKYIKIWLQFFLLYRKKHFLLLYNKNSVIHPISFFLPWFSERSLLSFISHELTVLKFRLSFFIPIIISHYYLILLFLFVAVLNFDWVLLLIYKFWLVSFVPFLVVVHLLNNASSLFESSWEE